MKSHSFVMILVILNCNFIVNTLFILSYLELIMTFCIVTEMPQRELLLKHVCSLLFYTDNKIRYFFW